MNISYTTLFSETEKIEICFYESSEAYIHIFNTSNELEINLLGLVILNLKKNIKHINIEHINPSILNFIPYFIFKGILSYVEEYGLWNIIYL